MVLEQNVTELAFSCDGLTYIFPSILTRGKPSKGLFPFLRLRNTIYLYPDDVRKAIYTTNAIKSLNSVIRKATKKRKLFPNDESALKMTYLAITEASKKRTMPIHNWEKALNHFIIEFVDRVEKHVN